MIGRTKALNRAGEKRIKHAQSVRDKGNKRTEQPKDGEEVIGNATQTNEPFWFGAVVVEEAVV